MDDVLCFCRNRQDSLESDVRGSREQLTGSRGQNKDKMRAKTTRLLKVADVTPPMKPAQ